MNNTSSQVKTITQLGHPVLRQVAQIVDNIQANEIQQLIDDMLITVAYAGGVGIAAPQINASKRIFIVCSKANQRYPEAPDMEATAMINPEIIDHSQTIIKDWEGCLSVPALRGLVPRFQQINVAYFDRTGRKVFTSYDGFLARIFQHELDHLNGLTFLDRLESSKDLYSEAQWYQQFVE